jgi:predicted DCC family thiol-disulfide oxidoreductase YuxK
MSGPIVLYDGTCGLCNRFVQFALRHDRRASFRFASLQSPFASAILVRHGLDPEDLNTVYVVVRTPAAERLFSRSDAVLYVLKELRGLWCALAIGFRLIPGRLRDAAYRAIARRRYRLFGRSRMCLLPRQEDRERFLDL